MIGDHSFTPVVAGEFSEAEDHKWDEKGGSLSVSSYSSAQT